MTSKGDSGTGKDLDPGQRDLLGNDRFAPQRVFGKG